MGATFFSHGHSSAKDFVPFSLLILCILLGQSGYKHRPSKNLAIKIRNNTNVDICFDFNLLKVPDGRWDKLAVKKYLKCMNVFWDKFMIFDPLTTFGQPQWSQKLLRQKFIYSHYFTRSTWDLTQDLLLFIDGGRCGGGGLCSIIGMLRLAAAF